MDRNRVSVMDMDKLKFEDMSLSNAHALADTFFLSQAIWLLMDTLIHKVNFIIIIIIGEEEDLTHVITHRIIMFPW